METLREVIEKLLEENYQLEKENKKIKDELKEANADVGIFIEEQKQLKDRISNLLTENTKLQNDLFTEELNKDETDDYINTLKNELFQSYLFEIKLINCIYYLYDTTH